MMNPAPSKYSIYYEHLSNNRKNNGIPNHFLLNNLPIRNGIVKALMKIEQKEGAG